VAGAAGQAGSAGGGSQGLLWPADCVPFSTCSLGYPDIDDDGKAFDCGLPGYKGHEGSDIAISQAMMDQGTAVYAAQAGTVLWTFDGHYDRCPNDAEPDCQAPALAMGPGVHSGYMVCTEASDDYCTGTQYTNGCYWCFYGSNVVVIRHEASTGVFATRYDHLRKNSIVVKPGDKVTQGQTIAEAGSAGKSTGPHLHFEVWVGGFYQLADPWQGLCGPNTDHSLWMDQPKQ
jgi:murein DD-endopeptidase MepM/ murein hydrolase activator NlpD